MRHPILSPVCLACIVCIIAPLAGQDIKDLLFTEVAPNVVEPRHWTDGEVRNMLKDTPLFTYSGERLRKQLLRFLPEKNGGRKLDWYERDRLLAELLPNRDLILQLRRNSSFDGCLKHVLDDRLWYAIRDLPSPQKRRIVDALIVK